MYTIKPIYHGMFKNYEKSIYTYRKNYGKKIAAPLVSYLIEGNGLTVLVDTGPMFPCDENMLLHTPIHDGCNMIDALRSVETSPDKIDSIIITHLHWDRCHNLELFPDVPIYVQKSEVHYAVTPLPSDTRAYGYSTTSGQPGWFAGFQRMRWVNGDATLAQDIRLVLLPGHSPGSQGVLVYTEEGKYLLAGDTYPLYENFESATPPGTHVNLHEWFASHDKARALCDFVLPGHDITILDRKVYGKRNG